MHKILTLLLLLSMSRCASSGRPIDPAKVASFEPGKTTYSEVVAALGPPTTIRMMVGGATIIAYGHSTMQMNPATFIPVVGLFAASADMHTESVSFMFDREGVMTNNLFAPKSSTGTPAAGAMPTPPK